jgi:hypothetical protein
MLNMLKYVRYLLKLYAHPIVVIFFYRNIEYQIGEFKNHRIRASTGLSDITISLAKKSV